MSAKQLLSLRCWEGKSLPVKYYLTIIKKPKFQLHMFFS